MFLFSWQLSYFSKKDVQIIRHSQMTFELVHIAAINGKKNLPEWVSPRIPLGLGWGPNIYNVWLHPWCKCVSRPQRMKQWWIIRAESKKKWLYFCDAEYIFILSYHINHLLRFILRLLWESRWSERPEIGPLNPPPKAIKHHAEGLDTEQLAGIHCFPKGRFSRVDDCQRERSYAGFLVRATPLPQSQTKHQHKDVK